MNEQAQVISLQNTPLQNSATPKETTTPSKMASSLATTNFNETADFPPRPLSPKSPAANGAPSPRLTISPRMTSPLGSPELRVTDSPDLLENNKYNGAIVFPTSPPPCSPGSTSPKSTR